MEPELVGLRELRHHAADYVRRAEAGERIAITDRGRVVAEMGPPSDPANVRLMLAANGHLVRGRGRRLPRPLPPRDGVQLSEKVQQMRDEERW
ncbi:type II toxin-antitoxin system prevent-host-death family antitoxin [Lentzea sp. PSKA42]|uniref:Type II toxin-antitoxin system prevent-host-death family antitoxin n=1 Tax=Lentzea indica TaxID=2604800 RepID=A0ABX1FH85_9PSEU|nr:type II toxin-antitoxin system prevent-host-death family antitoxin [Lentzea indica]NKE57973.1 type II toxin-antitoxin system prevent-host-death family antitoxin [Lentzea indica]